jgi:hypothetical protein
MFWNNNSINNKRTITMLYCNHLLHLLRSERPNPLVVSTKKLSTPPLWRVHWGNPMI